MCDFASTSYLVALSIYSFHYVKGQVILLSGVCEGEGGERAGWVRILFRCSTKGEIGVGWSLLFLGILGWEGGGSLKEITSQTD